MEAFDQVRDVGGFDALEVEEVTVARVVMLPASGGLLTEVLARSCARPGVSHKVIEPETQFVRCSELEVCRRAQKKGNSSSPLD